jgi:hypothetical protein
MTSRLLPSLVILAPLVTACSSGTGPSSSSTGDSGEDSNATVGGEDAGAEADALVAQESGTIPESGTVAETGVGAEAGEAGGPHEAGVASEGGAVYREGGTTGTWATITPSGAGSGVNGVVVNRLNGDVLADAFNAGVMKSTDEGATWTRVDHGTVSGGVVTGPAFDLDQNDPVREAVWSLDGASGWTNDGTTWTETMQIGRNWDFAATDWSSANPTTMFAAQHEAGGAVWVSTNAGQVWTKLSVIVSASGAGFPPPKYAMVGVMGATTLVYCNGAGIYRSTDTGATFTKVSDFNPTTRVPVYFKGVYYLGGDGGIMVSRDQGATWTQQGTALPMWVGPYFGTDEKSMVVADNTSIYRTVDGGMTWTRIASVPMGTYYNPQIWGGIAWDPIHNILYSAGEQSALLKMQM